MNFLYLFACDPAVATTMGGSNIPIYTEDSDCDQPSIVLECPPPVIHNVIKTDCPELVCEVICPEPNIYLESDCPDLSCPELQCPDVSCPAPVINNSISNTIDTQPIADELVSLTEAITMQAGEWAAIKIQLPVSSYAPNGNARYSSTTWTNTDSRPFLVHAIYNGSIEYDINNDGYGDTHLRSAWSTGGVYYGYDWTNLNSVIESNETVYVTCGEITNGECLIAGKYLNQ